MKMMNLHVISGNKQSETIQSRQLEIKLSEEDVRKITEKAGAHGLTVAELIEHFIGDLVYGTYTNGSDERMYANDWFERCGFGRFSDTFLQYLFENQILEDVLEEWDDIEDAQKEICNQPTVYITISATILLFDDKIVEWHTEKLKSKCSKDS